MMRLAVTEAFNFGNKGLVMSEETLKKIDQLSTLPCDVAMDVAAQSFNITLQLNEEAYETAMKKHRILRSEMEYFEWMICSSHDLT